MKYISQLLLCLLLISAITNEVNGQFYGRDQQSYLDNGKPYTKEFDAKGIEILKITNKHGYINISGWEEEKIVVQVIVNIETKSNTEAEAILELITLRNRAYSNTLDFKTIFADDFFSNYPLTINYDVKIPKRIQLSINNSIGDIKIVNMANQLQLTQSYGKLELKNIGIENAHNLHLSFVEGLVDSIGSIKANLSNCTLNLSNSNSIKGKTNYCMASFTNVSSLNINSFTDRFTISNSDSLTLNGSHFIGKINQLNTYGFCELEKGQLLISTSETIKELTISNQKVNTTVIIPSAVSYFLNGEVFNGRFTHPNPQALQLFKEHNNVTFSGKIGNNLESQANLVLFNKDSSITIKN